MRLYSGYGDLVWDSATWLGNGYFTGISDYDESAGIEATNMEVSLVGVPQALISLFLSESTHGSNGGVWLGFLDSSGAVIADPYLLFDGALSAPQIDDNPDIATISFSLESELVWLNRSSELRYTHESQQTLYEGDLGFQYVSGLDNWTGYWGNKKKSSTTKKKSTKKKDKSSRK